MKGDFYRRSSLKEKKLFSPTFILVLLIILVFATVHIFYPSFISGVTRNLVKQLWLDENSISEGGTSLFYSLAGNVSLAKKNRDLEYRLSIARTNNLKNKILEEENQALKEILGRKSFNKLTLAPVLRLPPMMLYDTLLVDIENTSGVEVGNRVVVNGNIVLGKISSIEATVAEVMLFSTPGVETDVFIGTSTASVTAIGEGSGNFTAKVPRDLDVKIGDSVILPDVSPLLFSTISLIESQPTDPFMTLLFQNPINIRSLRWVEIVVDNDEVPTEVGDIQQETASSTEDNEI